MIKAICINDREKPAVIPAEKWVKFLDQYHIIHVGRTPEPNVVITCTLKEITLGAESAPYDGLRIDRFAFDMNDMPALLQLMRDCAELNKVDINQLIKESNLELIAD